MNPHFGENAGFRILDELVCKVLAEPSLQSKEENTTSLAQGHNAGIFVLDEIVCNASEEA